MSMSGLHNSKRFARIFRHLHRQTPENLPETYHADQLTFISEGHKFFSLLFDTIAASRQYICIEYYKISADKTGLRLAEMILDARKRGVDVYLIYDYFGSLDTPDSYFKKLKQNGVNVLVFNPPSFRRGINWFDLRDHRKLTIIDGKTAFLGGRNIGDDYAGTPETLPLFHDVGFSISGAAVERLTELFSEVWLMEKGEKPYFKPFTPNQEDSCPVDKPESVISLVSGGPHHKRSRIRSAFRVAMATASTELLIANPYFLPGPLILRSLLRSARRGVTVRLLLPARSDVPLVRLLSRSTFDQLLKAGIQIYEMQNQILHAKLMVIDGVRTVIGSANMDYRSFNRNYEINAHIRSVSFGEQVHRHIEKAFSEAHEVKLADHIRRGVIAKLLERLLRPLRWFL